MDHLLRRLDLTSLRLFAAVCQEKNIARAAEREFIAPSAVSRRIAEIEAVIGLPVIERHQRGVSVTPVGETVLRYANQIIGSIESLGAELSRFRSGAKGSVRLAANISSFVQFLPEDIAAFLRIFPDVHLELEEQHSSDVLRMVDERSVDVGICVGAGIPNHFEVLPYRTDRLAIVLPKRHRLAAEAQVSFSETLGEKFVGLKQESALSQQLVRQAEGLGVQLDVRFGVGSLDALCRMVHVGLGVAVMPRLAAELYLHTLDIAVRPLSDDWALRELALVFQARDQLSASAEALVTFLTDRD